MVEVEAPTIWKVIEEGATILFSYYAIGLLLWKENTQWKNLLSAVLVQITEDHCGNQSQKN